MTYSLGHQSSGLEEWRRPTSNFGKMNSFSLQVSQKPSSNLREKYKENNILRLQKIVLADNSVRLVANAE
ncbi:hypothetical protein H5410_036933 [Solanum commersonii]|uniref:Uncharacterized protein n=1 Tax=Solanum commersonii TaxID=4109 RepID=A0A9J5Y6B3_SOLCO|nr:hypothetical protein H5410_036933 [Solanum commersonii]